MPAAGRPDGKYVHKMHYLRYSPRNSKRDKTACGKFVARGHTTRNPDSVTCKTCRKGLAYWHNREER